MYGFDMQMCVIVEDKLALRDEGAELTESTSMDSIDEYDIGPRFDPRLSQNNSARTHNVKVPVVAVYAPLAS
ncbi:hypothetical protein Pmar_PMAR018504 [Perkinsus marinus ATCC 50983]|uniref:Uncharacterized protein n=1 Tax=Perkinsus marinus (strain ATCC 50983 / TXsc) TaxID=423536 RepID=C5L002_PERM5|nr:hypothetical protein Pmar_PMAR018504 [Perkinsus marinus ATCC 50983]EER09860.1 hypothetical protein Pmar_PMAR018504 [Perkinsus marinus ATCC 50983]|eukprot:XP_002778065.1 hypothetical protein Pmar_PMAR018504 [Perkinsus marinus ATCC 50983]